MLPGFSAPPQTAWKPSCGCLLSFRPSAPYLLGLWISVLCQEPKFPFHFDPTLVVKSEIFEVKSFGMNERAFRTKSNQRILQDWGETKNSLSVSRWIKYVACFHLFLGKMSFDKGRCVSITRQLYVIQGKWCDIVHQQ